MSTTIAPRKSSRKATDVLTNGPIPSDSADLAIGNGPTLQDALHSAPTVPVTVPTFEESSDAFNSAVADFGRLIAGQRNALVRFYVQRGDVARRAINIKMGRSTDKATRAANRSSAVKALTMAAEINYDPTTEPKPKVDRWVSFSQPFGGTNLYTFDELSGFSRWRHV